jgi:hypothetical protein
LEYRVDGNKDAGSSHKKRIDPAVKAWLDRVLIPGVLKEYLAAAETRVDNGICPITETLQ